MTNSAFDVCILVIVGASVLSTTNAFHPPTPLFRKADARAHRHKPLRMAPHNLESESSQETLSSARLVTNADDLLQVDRTDQTSRRLFMASVLMGAGVLVGGDEALGAQELLQVPDTVSSLRYVTNPINKRSGVTLFDAEKSGYNLSFVTYLSRFLLNFDNDCQRWWFTRAEDLPRLATAEEINRLRLGQFGAFSASVEVGLQAFEGPDGPRKLMKSLLARYCQDDDTISENEGESSEGKKQKRKRREIREARRQIALLFGLLGDKAQPVQEITKLLAAVVNGHVTSVKMKKDVVLDGYAPGDEPPVVEFPLPQAGEGYDTATGHVVLEPTGKILRIDVVDHGLGYSSRTPPTVTVSRPQKEGGKAAVAKAKVVQNGPNKGSLESIQLVDPGTGYSKGESIQVEVSLPDVGQGAVLMPVLELYVDRIEVTNEGSGYATEEPVKIVVKPPPAVQLNDTMATENGSRAATSKLEGTIVGWAYPSAEKGPYDIFRREDDTNKIREFENALAEQYDMGSAQLNRVSGSRSGPDSSFSPRPLWGGDPSSSHLLDLLPAGIGLQYDTKSKVYALAVDTEFKEAYPTWLKQSSNRPLDPEFGPRSRSPIQHDKELGLSTYLRLCASGAVCASGVHLALTPLDVVKTKVQTNPVKYPTVGASFETVFKEEGLSTFFTGWVPTFIGHFLTGGVLYALTEFTRRYLTEMAGTEAMSLEVPIILFAAGTSAVIGACLSCPFEAVRIRSVAQPDFGPNFGGVLTRMVEEEGVGSLINAIPVFLVKNVPYAMAKFTVFDLFTEYMYETFPVANEDLKLSLLISLVGGILAGTSAALVSNPADAVISEMKKAKSDMTPQEAVNKMLENAGGASLFKGLRLRMVFYSLVASLQFLIYDGVRLALGVGPDDFKLYLDVLGGALQQSGGPV